MSPDTSQEAHRKRQRLAIFAASSSDGVLPPQVLPYLASLKPLTCSLVVACGHDLAPDERAKLAQVADHVVEAGQGARVFAGYQRGLAWAQANDLLQGADDLILCNDSCYGPVGPLAAMFSKMERRGFVVWGTTAHRAADHHLHSDWLVLGRPAFSSDAFEAFFASIAAGAPAATTESDEIALTRALAETGLKLGAMLEEVEIGVHPEDPTRHDPRRFPVTALEKGVPFFLAECLQDVSKNHEGPGQLLSWLKNNAPDIYQSAVRDIHVSRSEKATDVAFSVIMPTYNRAWCICAAVDALLAQTHGNFELVIVDDGSSDDTEGLIRRQYAAEVASGKIRYIPLADNQGVCAARNIGLAHARHPWIAYADSDNKVRPYFLAAMATAIVQNAEADAFYAQMIHVGSGKIVGKSFDREQLVRGNFIDLGVFVHRRVLVDRLGGFDRELRRLVDWDLCIRYTRHKDAVFLPFVVLDYTDEPHPDRITTRESLLKANTIIRRKHSGKPSVSTAILSYNHQEFVVEAIESALAQKGNYSHEILLADSGSIDGTARIMQRYAARYPRSIRNISLSRNEGMSAIYRHAFREAAGDCIAILEGDDYWLDPRKNEAQAEFLWDNTTATMVFSKVEILDMKKHRRIPLTRYDNLPRLLTGKHFAEDENLNPIVNFSSSMFRSAIMVDLPDYIYTPRLNEIAVGFYLDRLGCIGFIDKVMSVYRITPGSLWTGASRRSKLMQAIAIRESATTIARPEYRPYIAQQLTRRRQQLAELDVAEGGSVA